MVTPGRAQGHGPSLVLAGCDAYLAGAFARRFEREGWDVTTVPSVADAEHVAVRLRPSVLMFATSCVLDPAAEVKRLRALPTLLHTHIVLLCARAHMPGVRAALHAGAADYLLVGHALPADVVERMKRLVEV